MLTTKPRGTNDIVPGEVEKWQYIEALFREVCSLYGFSEIRTPVFEHTELFKRGVGETTDIVEKEMYTFTDRGDRSLTLRPEGTAPVVRSFLENKMHGQVQPVKLYYTGPMFRYDRPQAGRYRQFHQFGAEVFGARDAAVDAELIAMAMDFYGRLGLKELEVHINSVGCPHCRQLHREKLQEALRGIAGELCEDCRGRFDRNPMRILDCKNGRCRELTLNTPTTTACLCDDCRVHFESVKKHLDAAGVAYIVNERLVRGLDYYTNTAFEIMAAGIGAQSSIGGGGRYDGLVEQCGGPAVPGIGFALGVERILLTLQAQGVELPVGGGIDVFVATIGAAASEKAFEILARLRAEGISADKDYLGRSLKAQMKYADKARARYSLIIGDEELARGVAVVRTMGTGEQETVDLDKLADKLKRNFAPQRS